jgi:predicted RecB family nuclease
MDQGQLVGIEAQRAFPGGVLVESSHEQLGKALSRTAELVSDRSVPAIFEATFETDDVLVRVDVLKREADNTFRILEVKSSTELKDHYRYDIGIQKHVVSRAGVSVASAGLMHLNRDYVYEGGDYDRTQLFSVLELTPELAIPDSEIQQRTQEQLRVLSQPEPPDVAAGRHCSDPVECEFYALCNQPLPAYHVSFLPNISAKKIEELAQLGITSIHNIPDDFLLSDRQRIACTSVESGQPWFGPELRGELEALEYPLCFMDFETVYPALPRFPGLRPYDHVPFQWSVHRMERPGDEPQHFEFLAEEGSDPRVPFVESLIAAVEGAKTVVVYNESFEKTRLQELAHFLPEHAEALNAIRDRVWDLLACVRRNVYHPAFAGSYSLKSVLPALVPDMTYQGLEVAHGGDAVLAYEKIVDPDTPPEERKRLREALLRYCGQDTLSLIKIHKRLLNAQRRVFHSAQG